MSTEARQVKALDEDGLAVSILVVETHQIGMSLIFGVKEQKPLRGFPEGRVRIRARNEAFMIAFVKTATGIRKFYVEDHEDHWSPGPETGYNDTVNDQ